MQENDLKIFIGPTDTANMGAILGDAFRQRGIKVTVVSIGIGPFQDGMRYDKVLTPDIWRLNKTQRLFKYLYGCLYCFIKYFPTHNVFIFLWGNTLLPLNLDLPIHKLFRKTTVMRFLGSDIRNHEALEAAAKKAGHKYYMSEELVAIDREKSHLSLKQKRLMIRMVERYATQIISGPQFSQLLTRPYHMVFVPLDINNILYNNKPNPRPIVVHAPSNEAFKGTSYILKAVEQLKSEGYDFDFRLFRNMSNAKVRETLSSADIAVDQLFVFSAGMFALEAMAAGCAVLGGNAPEFSGFPKELPIIHSNPDNLYQNLKMLLEKPDLRHELGEQGRKYVEKYHDHRKIADDYIRLIIKGEADITYHSMQGSTVKC